MTDQDLLLRARRHPLAAAVARGLSRARVPEGAVVLVAASGGADSQALLALVAGTAARGRVQASAGHVDHGLRDGSREDAACAAELAGRLGVPFALRRLELAAGAALADRARTGRYAALGDMAAAAGAGFVLTAHHADDQLETMLLAIARGAGLGGVGGMPSRRALAVDGASVALVRPCLRIARDDLRAACADLGIAWREDPTNERRDTPRGIVRHAVLPALAAIAPGVPARAARCAEFARLGDVLLESHVAAMRSPDGSFPRTAFAAAPEALAASAVRLLVGDGLDDATRWAAAEAIVDDRTDPRRFPVAGGGELVVDAHRVRMTGTQGDGADGVQRS